MLYVLIMADTMLNKTKHLSFQSRNTANQICKEAIQRAAGPSEVDPHSNTHMFMQFPGIPQGERGTLHTESN